MNPLTQSKNTTILPVLIAVAVAMFALSPQGRAACRQGCDISLNNTFLGDFALGSNTTGTQNTATGSDALVSNTTGSSNTANGVNALFGNNGSNNTATGFNALYSNGAGNNNTATGFGALKDNTNSSNNTATGDSALHDNTHGGNNTAIGAGALQKNTLGSSNIAVGHYAGFNLTTGSNNIDIYNEGFAGDDRTIRTGLEGTQTATFIAGVYTAAVAGTGVVVNLNGQLGVAPCSERFKAEIKPMDKASEAILALKPVTFRYQHELDPEGIPQFGLVAEQVEKVNPDLVTRDTEGKIFTVRYEAVNAMLLNEFLKEHKAFVMEQHNVEKLEAVVARQQKQIEALTAGLQKVSAQVEMSKAAPQTVLNDR